MVVGLKVRCSIRRCRLLSRFNLGAQDLKVYPLTKYKSQSGNTILLIVLVVPDEPSEWVVYSDSSIIVRHDCYWFCFQGCSLSKHQHEDSKEQIKLLRDNYLTPDSFPLLMQKIADGEM
jgi:hypothetical protein